METHYARKAAEKLASDSKVDVSLLRSARLQRIRRVKRRNAAPSRQRNEYGLSHPLRAPVVEPRPYDDRDAAQDLARELADMASQLPSLKGETNAWLSDGSYDAPRHRPEDAHAVVEAAAVEARRRMWLNEGRER